MKKDIRCIVGLHKYETVKQEQCKCMMKSIFFVMPCKVDAVTVVEKCNRANCNKHRAYLTTGNNKSYIDINYIKGIAPDIFKDNN